MDEARRLLVLYTGGTLGMVETEQGWTPGADLAGWLDALLDKQFPGIAHDLVELDPLIDSSNATPASWQRIVDVIEAHRTSHDAFVVLHGTDTLSFTGAALSWALGDQLPVVLTGAQRSLVRPDSDALRNVIGAIRSALAPQLHRVAIYFDTLLMPAEHTSKISTQDDHAFESMNAAPLAQMVGDDLVFTPGVDATAPVAIEGRQPFTDTDIVVLTLVPGLRHERVTALLQPTPQAVIVRAYGSGNAPDDQPGLLDALGTAHRDGAVVVVTTQCPHGEVQLGHYAVSAGLLGTGAISGGSLPTESLVARLNLLLSQQMTPDEIRAALR